MTQTDATFGDVTYEDPTLTRVPERHSALDALRDELAVDTAREPLTLPIPLRKSLSMRYDTNIDGDLLNAWRKMSKERKSKDPTDIDTLKFSCLILANQGEALLRDGDEVLGNDGNPLSFAHGELRAMLSAASASDAVRKLYGGAKFTGDGDILNSAAEVSRVAGFGDEELDAEESPTNSR